MAKAPFERVFSLIDRKKLFLKVAKEQIEVIIKNTRGELFHFKPHSIDKELSMLGDLLDGSVRDYEKVTVLFYVDKERYFVNTRVKKNEEGVRILNDPQFYRLNRRTAFRVQVPAVVELSYQIYSIRNIEMNRKASVLEFSSTGARIYWTGDSKLSKGTILKGVLQWGKGKSLPVDGMVVHSPEKGIYALRFVSLNSILVNRLKMLSVEIQQAIHFK